MLNRLVIGTANWGRDYNGHNISEKEQNFIMEYMKEVGIEWLEVATAYGTADIGLKFNRIIKKQDYECGPFAQNQRNIYLAHSITGFNDFHDGVSIDMGWEVPREARWVEFPYSIMNKNIPKNYGRHLIARSIFCKGKALKYFSPRDCIDFVLMNPRIDKVILGVDSVDQLKENVAHLVKMEKFTHNEEVDTRKF